MKLTKILRVEILKAYNAYWDGYLKGDVKSMSLLLADEYTQVGSAETEVFSDKKSAVRFLRNTIDQVAGKAEMRNRQTRLEPQGNLVLVHELCDLYVLAEKEWVFYAKFRASTLMQMVRGKWKILHQHSSFPDARTGEGENIAAEKIAAENQQLREAVKRRTIELEHKNRELEIETTLECVRSVAMGMKEPADMLEVCRTISLQMQSLGVQEIRNVQTAIFYESRGTYMNYEYYARHKKTITTETSYTNHKVHKAFAAKMLKGKGEVFVTHIKGKKVKDWIAYQKTTNVFIDRYLEKASSLNYYWHSLGPVALGISTYVPLSKEELGLFKRFLDVFELAYTRYLDIEQAIAQARKAQVEASLEKVRAQALGMRKPEDLPDVCEVLFKELQTLGFIDLRNAMVNIHNDEKETFLNYDYSDAIGKSITPLFYSIHPVIEKQIKQIRSARDAFSETVFTGKDLREWKEFRRRSGEKPDPRVKNITALHYYFYSIGTGSIGISTFSSIGEEKLEVLKRFRNVFDFAYRRYMDVAQAEAHARESQIELSLERVRARSMAMHSSDELVEAADVVFQQLKTLGIESIRTGIATFDGVKETLEIWSRAHAGGQSRILGIVPRNSHPFFTGCYDAWKAKKKFFFQEFSGKEVVKYYRKMSSLLSYPASKTHNLKEVFYTFFFPEGSVNVVRTANLTDDELGIMQRFARVFGLMYRRFLDLQIAEAQTRESQIQLALERVRARTMAMQHSDELKHAAALLFQQVKSLGVPAYSCGYNIWETNAKEFTSWMSTQDGSDFNAVLNIPLTEDANFIRFRESRKKGEQFFVLELRGKRMQEHYQYLKTIPAFKAYFDYATSVGFDLPQTQIHHLANFSQGNLLFITLEPCPEFHDVFKRFAAVFEQTYTRFLDLQKAEAQAKESQIQLALERVRARTMAMQKSDELAETAAVLFQQFKEIDKAPKMLTIGIMNEREGLIEFWVTDWRGSGSKVNRKFDASIEEPVLLKKIFAAWKEQRKSTVIELVGKKLQAWIDYRVRLSGVPDDNDYSSSRGFVIAAFFSKGMLSISAYEPRPPETVQLLERFAGVFDLTYTRFLDLQKAEAQARESQVQLALERVRARTMAMQRSDELQDAAILLFQQIKSLGIQTGSCGFNIWNKKEKTATVWMSSAEGGLQAPFEMPLTESPVYKTVDAAMKKGNEFLVEEVGGKTLVNHFDYLLTLPGIGDTIKRLRKTGYVFPERMVYHFAFFTNGYLSFHTHEPYPEAHDIFKRFGKVFDQTYTRFLDLQKAEAQAKEARIETALERIRSRTMAMQKSEELKEVIQVVYDQFIQLNIHIEHTGFILDYKARDDMHIWLADRHEVPFQVTIPYFDCAHWNSFVEAKEKGRSFFANQLSFEEKNRFYRDLFKLIPGVPEETSEYYFGCPGLAISTVLLENVGLYIENFSGVPYSEEENNTLMRFGNVFQQTYTRFLDLQKAEAQAREAQIQLALERVRARTMAMQKSHELAEVAGIVFNQLTDLGIRHVASGFVIFDRDKPQGSMWMSFQGKVFPKSFEVNFALSPVLNRVYDAWKIGQPFYENNIEGEQFEQHIRLLKTLFGARIHEVIQKIGVKLQSNAMAIPTRMVMHHTFFESGSLVLTNVTSIKEQDILNRFATVFNQAYTRFLDLQKTEAQAREAQIEVALERIRARAMAMHASNELEDVAHILREQMGLLGQPELETSVINLFEENSDQILSWYAFRPPALSSGEILTGSASFKGSESALTREMTKAYRAGKKEYTIEADAQKAMELFRVLERAVPAIASFVDTIVPDRVWYHLAFFSGGTLLMVSHQPPSEEAKSLQQRAASVFDLAYRRYQDLKHAEAQAREAQIEAALEKVRGRAMGMHNSGDLSTAASTVFTELRKLGIHPIRSGVGLKTKEPFKVLLYAATTSAEKDALSLVGQIDMSAHPCLTLQYESCMRKENYFPVLVGEDLREYYKRLSAQISVPSLTEEQIRLGHFGYYFPFADGYFYAWNGGQPFSENEIEILIRFKAIIDLTFRRYLELQRAEAQAREAQIELSLERIRARVTAMRESSDLLDIVVTMRSEFVALGHEAHYFWHMRWLPEKYEKAMTSGDGGRIGMVMTLPRHIHGDIKLVANWEKSDEPTLIFPMVVDTAVEYVDKMIRLGDFQQVDPQAPTLDDIRHIGGLTFIMARTTHGEIGYSLPGPVSNPPAEAVATLARLAGVFDLAYRRFEDLKIAEAQAHQAHLDLIQLQAEKKRAEEALTELNATQAQLVQQEKLASLGQLTAGIAHEIKNPLNFVNNFSSVSVELIDEVMDEIRTTLPNLGTGEIPHLLADVKTNLAKIIEHGTRADGIVKSMLQHARGGSGKKEPVDFNSLVKEYVNLSFHGMRANKKPINVDIDLTLDVSVGKIPLIAEDFSRVVVNLCQNAFDAMREKFHSESKSYLPKLVVRTKRESHGITLEIGDNGPGIPDAIRDKILQPFFTTKKGTQGTGLGLSITHDIVKAHGGSLNIESSETAGTVFKVLIPSQPAGS